MKSSEMMEMIVEAPRKKENMEILNYFPFWLIDILYCRNHNTLQIPMTRRKHVRITTTKTTTRREW